MVMIDQLSKGWAVARQVAVVNRGVSGGVGGELSVFILVLLTVVILVILYKTFYSFWLKRKVMSGLFFGAAISNLLDRMVWGGVRDWLVIPVIGWHNNLADYVLVILLILFIVQLSRHKYDQKVIR